MQENWGDVQKTKPLGLYGAICCSLMLYLFAVVACERAQLGAEPTREPPKSEQTRDASAPDTRAQERTQEPTQDAGAPELPAQETPTETKPSTSASNVLLIIIDDYGLDVSALYQDKDGDGKPDDSRAYASTPHLDGLCKSGVRMSKAWATSQCSSTRATILTGRYGFRTGIGGAIPRNKGIDPKEWSLPKLLDRANTGYTHANIGKWHLGTTDALSGLMAPNTMGWGHYTGSISGSLSSYTGWEKVTNGQSQQTTAYATSDNVNDAIKWLEQRPSGKPWFLWLAFNAPHTPFHLPPKELHSQGQLSGTQQDLNSQSPAYYRAMVEALDTEVGRLLAWLKQKGSLENTNIIFLGDNGTPSKAVEAPYDKRRAKATLYQGGIHVPMCISGPAVVGKGRVIDAMVHSVDIFATTLQFAGLDLKKDLPSDLTLDAVSFLPLLQDAKATPTRTWMFNQRFDDDPSTSDYAMWDGQYKYLQISGQESFYDLNKDPLEQTDLLGSQGKDALTPAQKQAYERLTQQLATLLKGP